MLDKQMAQGQIAIAAAFTGRTRTQMGKQQESTGIFCGIYHLPLPPSALHMGVTYLTHMGMLSID
jgi:hypothetical protein